MLPSQILSMAVLFIGLIVLRFGVPMLLMWLINKGCCAMQKWFPAG